MRPLPRRGQRNLFAERLCGQINAVGDEALPRDPADSYSLPDSIGVVENTNPLSLIACSQLQRATDDEHWLLHGYFARGLVTLVSALPKAGKTTLLAHLLRAMGKDGDFLGRPVKACRVLYVTEERESRWAERRDALGLADHITFIVRPFPRKPSPKEWQKFLDELRQIQEREKFDLIVFDTLSNLWPVRDENSAGEVQAALMPLHAAIGEAALALIHHLRKSDGTEGTASRGSGTLLAWVDIITEMRRLHPQDRKDTRRVLTGYGRYEQTPTELVVNLDAQGYTAEGDRAEVQNRDLSAILDTIIPADPPGRTVKELLEAWPGDHGPNQTALDKALKNGTESERWIRCGKGRKGDPYRYHHPTSPTSGKSPWILRADGHALSERRDGYVNPEATPDDLNNPFDNLEQEAEE